MCDETREDEDEDEARDEDEPGARLAIRPAGCIESAARRSAISAALAASALPARGADECMAAEKQRDSARCGPVAPHTASRQCRANVPELPRSSRQPVLPGWDSRSQKFTVALLFANLAIGGVVRARCFHRRRARPSRRGASNLCRYMHPLLNPQPNPRSRPRPPNRLRLSRRRTWPRPRPRPSRVSRRARADHQCLPARRSRKSPSSPRMPMR